MTASDTTARGAGKTCTERLQTGSMKLKQGRDALTVAIKIHAF